ncbi:MAG: hypothetical protein A2016_12950 [Elusimicrobia bacterium GWF2_62_30]|nr:MAG: hypothetical protein A2016_12950 [Elusimicrobia bacterium GWF2_62_30]
MTGRRAPGSVVAFENGKPLDWGIFTRHVGGLCRELDGRPRGRWLAAANSSYAFAVSLCALWQTGNTAVLPPNLQKGSLEELTTGIRGMLGDVPGPGGMVVLPPAAFSGDWEWKDLDSGRSALWLYTSGSAGGRKGVPKTLANIEEELAALERTFGPAVGDSAVLATVSHQHIYGLLFRLFWPLCSGRPFISETPLLWDELPSGGPLPPAVCLVSSPAHLNRVCSPGADINPPPGCRAVFSSGAPLAAEAALAIRARWGLPVREVFGSTETGGVGWRVQSGPEASPLWAPLPGVRVSASRGGRLRVSSPFVSPPLSGGWRAMGDRGEVLPDGRFGSAGRVDRVVKVAGKRLSLDEMERRLKGHPWVAAAVLSVLEDGPPGRAFIGALLVLNPAGKENLAAGGRPAAAREFRRFLSGHFDAVTLPRFFRYAASIPLNSQGKISRADISKVFNQPAGRRSLNAE